jgi:POT family proton-dependent oligopeptide transporter
MEHPAQYENGQRPGALGLGQAMATRIYCCFYIFYYVTPILVAVIADTQLGQYTTLVVSAVLYCLGITALTITAIPAILDAGWGIPGLILAMFLIGLGGGKSPMPQYAYNVINSLPNFRWFQSDHGNLHR